MGALIHDAIDKCRHANKFIHIGISGEHGGDPDSVHYYHHLDADFITCAPEAMTAAKVAAAQAQIRSSSKQSCEEYELHFSNSNHKI